MLGILLYSEYKEVYPYSSKCKRPLFCEYLLIRSSILVAQAVLRYNSRLLPLGAMQLGSVCVKISDNLHAAQHLTDK